MAAYCTIDELEDRYGLPLLLQLSDRGEIAPEAPDPALFDRAIADASALVDSYLAARYLLPLATVPDVVVDLCQAIAIYKAHPSVAADKIRADYQDALKQLQQIAAGVMRLDVAGVEPTTSGVSEVRTNDPCRPLSPSSLKGYI